MIMFVISYTISYHIIPGGSICSSSAAALAAAAASLLRFLVSAPLTTLLSLRRSALILSASAMDTIRDHGQMFTSYSQCEWGVGEQGITKSKLSCERVLSG